MNVYQGYVLDPIRFPTTVLETKNPIINKKDVYYKNLIGKYGMKFNSIMANTENGVVCLAHFTNYFNSVIAYRYAEFPRYIKITDNICEHCSGKWNY